MEIAIGIVLGLAALATLIAIGNSHTHASVSDGREEFFAIHGRYPTEADFEDPIA